MTERNPSTRITIDSPSITKALLLGVLVALASFFVASNAGAEEGPTTISQVDLELDGVPLTQLASADSVLSDDIGVKIVSATIFDGGSRKVVATDGPISIGSFTEVSSQRDYERLFASPIQAADYILVVETNGDADIKLTGLDEFGLPKAGSEKSLHSFQWNTGVEAQDGETYWISILAADSLAGSQGIRTQSDAADVQILPLEVVSEEKVTQKPKEQPVKIEEQPEKEKEEQKSDKPAASAAGEIAFHAAVVAEKSSGSCEGEDVFNAQPQTEIVFCYLVTNTGPVPLTDIMFSDENLNLSNMYLPRVKGNDLLFPGDSAVYSTKLTSSEVSTIFSPKVSAVVADEKGAIQEDVAKVVAGDSVQLEIAAFEEAVVAGAVQDSPQPDEVLPKESPVEDKPTAAVDTAESPEEVETPTALAFTGIETTLILLVLAAGALFFGNTVRLAAVKEKSMLR